MRRGSDLSLGDLDRLHVWHPFTQMSEWMANEPRVILSGRGAVLKDQRGHTYLDANSSIWTNLHGHHHPVMNRALHDQLKKIAHSSALGLANEPASLLAAKLVSVANPTGIKGPSLSKVFFSDDGSTGMEAALKLSFEFARRTRGIKRPKFLSLGNAYHGDTLGAVSLGQIDLFHRAYDPLLFQTTKVMSPFCYRCPFNRAAPERADARTYRKCKWECIGEVEKSVRKVGKDAAAMVVEPLLQGAAGMVPQPDGWLSQVASILESREIPLIADEVMTGFGRTGSLFASHQEKVQPDFLVLAKGLTGGYLPMAATLTHEKIFAAFLGRYEEFKTFFHGHSYTGNQLGAAASLASLSLLEEKGALKKRQALAQNLQKGLQPLWKLPQVGDIRQVGLVAGVELVADWKTRQPFDFRKKVAMKVCEWMAKNGVLTRPIGNVIVIMPPYCTTAEQVSKICGVLEQAIKTLFAGRSL